MELDDAVLAVARALEVEQQPLGRRPVLHLHRQHGRAELELARRLVPLPQPLEHRARVGVALLLDVELRERPDSGFDAGSAFTVVSRYAIAAAGDSTARISDFSTTARSQPGFSASARSTLRIAFARMPMSLRPACSAASATA